MNPKNKLICENDMTRALAWNWLTPYVVMGSWRRSLFLQIYEPNWRRLGAAAFKMVVGLLSPQLSRFFQTVTVFDSPALPNNCHKRLIIHYRFFVLFFLVQKIKSVMDVNSRLESLCLWLTASSKFISFFFLSTLQFTNWLHFLILFFLFIVFRFRLDSCQLSITMKNTVSYLVTLRSKPHP